MTESPSPAEADPYLEPGRLLFAGDWQFIAAAPTVDVLPPMQGMEIALAGRSNVVRDVVLDPERLKAGAARP